MRLGEYATAPRLTSRRPRNRPSGLFGPPKKSSQSVRELTPGFRFFSSTDSSRTGAWRHRSPSTSPVARRSTQRSPTPSPSIRQVRLSASTSMQWERSTATWRCAIDTTNRASNSQRISQEAERIMIMAEPKRLTTGALGGVEGPPSRGWCSFSMLPGECVGYCGLYVVSVGLQTAKHFRTINVQWIGHWGLFRRCGSSWNQ